MTAVSTTTTKTTTTATQQGQKLVIGSQANTQSVGNFVTDVSISPYINPTIISFYGYNLRPNQLIHVFFDSVLVDQYCAPGVVPTGAFDTSTYTTIPATATWGTPIYTNSQGMVAGQFAIPAATFKTGDRVLEVTDVTSLTLGQNALTTQASAIFTASNLNVTKHAVTLTTVNPQISTSSISNTVVTTSSSTNTTILPDLINVVNNVVTNTQIITVPNVAFSQVSTYAVSDFNNAGGGGGGDPIAQAISVETPLKQSGVFVTSLDLFFQKTAQVANNGVTVFLCEMTNGYPNTTCILPFSTVHLPLANIAVSATANVSTNFKFEAPVFLNNGMQYAFIIKPDGNDPDYAVYTANVGDIDITTGYQVYSQPIVGTAYYGATSTTWTPLQTEYIKFNLRRATFMAAQGDAYFQNDRNDQFNITGLSYNNTSVSLIPGDMVYQSTNSTPNTTNTSVSGIFKFFDNVRNIIYITNSTANFSNSATVIQFHRFANASVMTPNTTTIIAYANTTSLYNQVVDAYVPQTAQITPAGTSLVYGYKGTSNTYALDTAEIPMSTGIESEFYDKERIVASISNETGSMSGNKSFTLHANLSTTSSYVSPMIDLVRNQQLVIQNKVDAVSFNYNEFFNYSNTQSKYVSRIVTLAQGQDAQDMQIALTAHRPPGTDITVWVKFLNGEDSDAILAKTWTPLINQGQSIFADPSNPSDYKEYNFVTASAYAVLNTTGTITANATSANIVGVSTKFGTEVQVGWWISMAPNTTFTETPRQIISITNTTFLTLNAPFGATAGYAANVYYLVVPPTVAYKSVNSHVQIAGTVATSITNNAIIGTGTNFVSQFIPGNIIDCANDAQVIISVTNSTYLTVAAPWTSAVSGANAFIVTPTGITYLNSNSALYNTFKQFQIKFVLQSNDSSKVPFVDDLRCLALQL